jgi:hypothetical protein
MLIAKVQDNQVIELADYRDLFPNTSFPTSGPDAEFLAANSCMTVTVFKPYDNATEKLVAVNAYVEGDTVYTVAIESLTEEELDGRIASLAAKVRAVRNQKLADSDWTQVEDAPVDKTVWAAYRQELRDITNQAGFPTDVVMPLAPGEQSQLPL